MNPISIALGLAQFAPVLMRYFGVGEKSVAVAEKVIDTAKIITGTSTGPEALEAIKANQELQVKFQTAVMENESALERMYLQDTADARKRDSTFIEKGTRNYRADALTLLSVVVVIAVFSAVWADPDIPEFTKGIVTLLLGRFLGYLDNIFNFEFGTTRSSKTKDDTISKLSTKD